MIRPIVLYTMAALAFVTASTTAAQTTDADMYRVVFHYQITIDRSADIVWPHLIDQKSWIGFDLIHVSGTPGQEGEVIRLYEGQGFYVEVVKVIPDKLFAVVNLPSTFEGEDSTGIAIFSLAEVDGQTVVSVTMSREYTWLGEGPNPMRAIRQSAEFEEQTRATWEDNFLPKLRELAEGAP